MGVLGASSQEEVVWAIVRYLATQHWKFEKDKENEEADAVMPPQPVTSTKRDGFDAVSVYGSRRRFWRRPEGCS